MQGAGQERSLGHLPSNVILKELSPWTPQEPGGKNFFNELGPQKAKD